MRAAVMRNKRLVATDLPRPDPVPGEVLVKTLACVKQAVGSLDRVTRVVKVIGFVNAGRDFDTQPAAINGASDLLERLFGEAGRHAGSAVGLSSLPSNVSIEIELIVEVR